MSILNNQKASSILGILAAMAVSLTLIMALMKTGDLNKRQSANNKIKEELASISQNITQALSNHSVCTTLFKNHPFTLLANQNLALPHSSQVSLGISAQKLGLPIIQQGVSPFQYQMTASSFIGQNFKIQVFDLKNKGSILPTTTYMDAGNKYWPIYGNISLRLNTREYNTGSERSRLAANMKSFYDYQYFDPAAPVGSQWKDYSIVLIAKESPLGSNNWIIDECMASNVDCANYPANCNAILATFKDRMFFYKGWTSIAADCTPQARVGTRVICPAGKYQARINSLSILPSSTSTSTINTSWYCCPIK